MTFSAGGAIYNERGALVIDRSKIENNTTSVNRAQPGAGGGVHNRMADLTITASSISGNSAAGRGGGLYHNQGDLSISSSTIANNSSNTDGGGVYAVTSATVDRILVQSSTVSGNTSTQTGGLYLRGHTTIRHSTIVRNTGGGSRAGGVVAGDGSARFELDHTIVADNSVGESSSPAPDLRMYLPMFNVSVRNSLIGDSRGTTLVEAPLGSPDANGNLIGKSTAAGGSGVIDPLLGPLFVNGGPTLTHALLPGSPALDAGTLISGTPLGYDQRGNPYRRAVDANFDGRVRIDIGAYESQGMPRFTPGDFNRDGVVDARDYSVWRETIGTKITPLTGADANGSGIVDQADYNIWKANFGKGLSFGGRRGAIVAAAEMVEPAQAVEPAVDTSTRESSPQPLTLPVVNRSANSRLAARRARLAAAPTDQILAQWSAAQSRALARRISAAVLDTGEAKRDDATQDGTSALDLAFAAIAPL